MILRLSVLIYTLLGPSIVLACPACAGSTKEDKTYTVIILGIFILLCYIPYMLIYRLIKKNKDINQIQTKC
jgi:hypothetical protein